MCTFYSCFDGLLSAIWYLDSVSASYNSQENTENSFWQENNILRFCRKILFCSFGGNTFLWFGKRTQFCGLAKELNFVVWQKKLNFTVWRKANFFGVLT